MSYQSRELNVLAYANGFTLWAYNPQGESIEAMTEADYFNRSGNMVRLGDLIVVSVVDDRGGAKGCILHVCGIDEGRVDVESITPGGLLFFGAMAAAASQPSA